MSIEKVEVEDFDEETQKKVAAVFQGIRVDFI